MFKQPRQSNQELCLDHHESWFAHSFIVSIVSISIATVLLPVLLMAENGSTAELDLQPVSSLQNQPIAVLSIGN
ncbi:hypothetical protein Pse7367_0931 [Thalassoporum mexicanum PCC 7367]|uniref:hypothetical protein n=1 Tax=Thalassoporum mexicanum TaxID=3457544 RepID=UPI00029FB9A3|nr:hypothetical protein [Pseudanabaena sp. PCC 7367]AFY69231.1 hypothetical protein Pse7367_0931 [Pseudanabaena sp. PCC 7367]